MATNNSGYFYNLKEKPPCTSECHERSQKCHSECKKYIDWKNNYEARRRIIFESGMPRNIVDAYKIEKTKKKKER